MKEEIIQLIRQYPRTRGEILYAFAHEKRNEVKEVFYKMEKDGTILDMFSDGRYVVAEDLRNDSNY